MDDGLVTLVLSVHSRDSLWVLVDRRLSYGPRRPPVDSAVKVMRLETDDGVGLLAYAGLGATPRGTQPSDWMSAGLRGRGGLTFEQTLGVLAAAATRELPRYLTRIPGGAHSIVIPAFVRGVGARVYTIDNVVDRKTRRHWYRYTSHHRTAEPGSPSVRLGLGGTGGSYLAQKGQRWARALLGLVNAFDRGKISDYVIADRLASLNYEAHQNVRDGSVGPSCIVVWCRRPGAPRLTSGGSQQFYVGTIRAEDSGDIPIISGGMDVAGIIRVLMPGFLAWGATDFGRGTPSDFLDTDEINEQLANLPSEPDEKLR
jgi:hypothetical protein